MAEPVTIYTIGYQGRSLDDVVAALVAAKIDVVVDIRSRPISRRREFSKNRLAAHLNRHGVAYWHAPELGMPLDLLAHRSPLDGNATILAEYRRLLSHRLPALLRLRECAFASTVCLLCFEANAMHCHRIIVADQLRDQWHLEVRHL